MDEQLQSGPPTEPGDPEPLAEAPPQDVRDAQRERLLAAWKTPTGWRYWSAVNNSEVGLWYTCAAFAFMLFGGVLALLMRVQLAVPGNDFLTAGQYNQIFTMHGSIMMFLFAVPVLEAISIMLLPEMMGARDLPFPRLSAYGFWCFLIGGIFVCSSLFFGVAPQGGWFMYPPLTTEYQPGVGADIWLLGLAFIEVASIAAAVELIVGMVKCRPPGMRVNLIPLYAWYILVVAVMILFAFPPLIAGDLLLELERGFDWPFFDPDRGGDPVLWQHLFWIFGHPEVYIVFLPSIALVAMIVPTMAKTPIVGYSWVILAAVGTGFLSFGLWVHHMFTIGLPGISIGIFSAASQAVAIPTGIQLFCFLATLAVGRVAKNAATLFVLAGLATFVLGGLTGVMVAMAPFDFQAHDTYFIVGHLHYVLIGGTIFPLVAAAYYYYPLIRGKQLSERLGRVAFWLMLVGFNVTFLPMHFTGLLGLPRRVFTYPADLGFGHWNLLSTIGAFTLAGGFGVFVWDVLRPKKHQPDVKRNVWGAGTLEWLDEVPGKPWGCRSIPEIDSRYPLWQQPDFMQHVDEGRFYLPDAEEGHRETLVSSSVDAQPLQCLRVPGPTWLTHLAAASTGGVFIFATFYWWTPAIISGCLALATILTWVWTGTAWIPEKETKDIGLGKRLPLYTSGPSAVGWWAMFITMLGDITAFMALVFGYFFYWTVHEDFPPADLPGPGLMWPLIAAALLLGSWGLTVAARSINKRTPAEPKRRPIPLRRNGDLESAAADPEQLVPEENNPAATTNSGHRAAGRRNRTASNSNTPAWPLYACLLGAVLLAIAGGLALAAGPWTSGMDPTLHAYPATVWVLVLWTGVHTAVGVIMQLYCLARRACGLMTHRYDADIVNVTLYWHFLALTAAITVLVIAGFPLVA